MFKMPQNARIKTKVPILYRIRVLVFSRPSSVAPPMTAKRIIFQTNMRNAIPRRNGMRYPSKNPRRAGKTCWRPTVPADILMPITITIMMRNPMPIVVVWLPVYRTWVAISP
jgi:hypothetical protein